MQSFLERNRCPQKHASKTILLRKNKLWLRKSLFFWRVCFWGCKFLLHTLQFALFFIIFLRALIWPRSCDSLRGHSSYYGLAQVSIITGVTIIFHGCLGSMIWLNPQTQIQNDWSYRNLGRISDKNGLTMILDRSSRSLISEKFCMDLRDHSSYQVLTEGLGDHSCYQDAGSTFKIKDLIVILGWSLKALILPNFGRICRIIEFQKF